MAAALRIFDLLALAERLGRRWGMEIAALGLAGGLAAMVSCLEVQ
jgi:hypothetical protein